MVQNRWKRKYKKKKKYKKEVHKKKKTKEENQRKKKKPVGFRKRQKLKEGKNSTNSCAALHMGIYFLVFFFCGVFSLF